MDYTQDFLRDMHKNFPWFCFYRMKQYTKDFVSEGATKKSSWAILLDESDIEKWNNETNMNSVFFTPNGNYEASQWVRQAKNAKDIFCFVIERDDDEEFRIDFRKDFQYEPSIVVQTKRWYHCYWLLEKPVLWDTHGKKWDMIQSYLCNLMYGDVGAKDIARIYRLPSTTHWKDEKDGGKTVCVKYNPEIKHSFESFEELIEEEKAIATVKEFKKEYETDKGSSKDLFNEIETSVSVLDVLQDLWWRRQVKGTRILEDGKMSWWYRYYPAHNCLVNFSRRENPSRPEGWPFAVAKKMLWGAGKAYHYFHTEYGIWEKKTTQITSQVNDDKQVTGKDEDIVINTESAVITISFEDKKWFKTSWKGISEIIIWYFRVVGYYKELDNTHVYILKYVKKNGDEWFINIKELASQWELIKLLSKVGITFLGTKTDFLHILQYIHSAKKEFILIDKLWIYWENLIINKLGNYIYDDIHYVSCNTLNAKDGEIIKIGGPMKESEFMEEVESLIHTYEPKIIYSLFTMYWLYFFAEYIRRTFPFMPLTILVWLTQSGKSTLRWSMMKMFGIDYATETQASATEFSIMYMMNNFIPIHIAEFDNNVLKFDFDSFAKNVFDWTSSTRWTADQKLINYWFKAWLVVDWETRTLAPSVYTRSVMLFMNPRYKRKEKKKRKNITGYLSKNYNKIKDIEKKYNKIQEEIWKLTEHIQSSEKTRIINNYSLLIAFADCFWYRKIAEKHLLEQMYEQFSMKGEDNLDLYIKNILNFATLNRLPAKFTTNTISVDMFFDHMKYDKRKTSDAISNIQTVNHHFGNEGTDVANIPLEYLFKNKNLHPTFNRYMNMLEAWAKPDYGLASQWIRLFAETNWYKSHPYYESALYA